MTKEKLYVSIGEKYENLKSVLNTNDLQYIIDLTLEVYAMVHPRLVSGIREKTISDYVMDFMLIANKSQIFNREWKKRINSPITDTGNAIESEEAISFGKMINVKALCEYIMEVSKNTREIIGNLTIEQLQQKPSKKQLDCIIDVGGLTSDKRSIWLLDYWRGLTVAGMILTPLTDHHMMHLPPCLEHLPILEEKI